MDEELTSKTHDFLSTTSWEHVNQDEIVWIIPIKSEVHTTHPHTHTHEKGIFEIFWIDWLVEH